MKLTFHLGADIDTAIRVGIGKELFTGDPSHDDPLKVPTPPHLVGFAPDLPTRKACKEYLQELLEVRLVVLLHEHDVDKGSC